MRAAETHSQKHTFLMMGKGYLLEIKAAMTWLTPSKKKNLETMKVLTSMNVLAATTATRAIMFITRMALRIMKPGPARDRLKKGIMIV